MTSCFNLPSRCPSSSSLTFCQYGYRFDTLFAFFLGFQCEEIHEYSHVESKSQSPSYRHWMWCDKGMSVAQRIMIHINSRCCITYTWSWRTVFGCSCFFSVCIWLIAHSTWSLLSGLLDFTISNLEISLFFHRPYSGSHILLAFCLRVISILLLRFYHLYSAEGASRTHTSSNAKKET